MKQTMFIVKNNSKSEGTYFFNGEYKIIYPGEEVVLTKAPVNKTANVSITIFRKTVSEGVQQPLNKKNRK